MGCLDAGAGRVGWYSRRARASAERDQVQGPGRAEADLGLRTLAVLPLLSVIPSVPPARPTAISWHRVPELDRTRDRGHGRIELRTLKAVSVSQFGFPHVAQVLR